jgi:hypothetical protein
VKGWLVLAVLGLCLVAGILLATSASADSWEVAGAFSKNPARQNETINITMTFKNNEFEMVRLTFLGIHFDWMWGDDYYAKPDRTDSPVEVAQGESTVQTKRVTLPRWNASLGLQSYHFRAEFQVKYNWSEFWQDMSGVSWGSVNFTILEADTDGDGVVDSLDAFPDDPDETVDTDQDGVGDNGDPWPEDPEEWADSDGDGHGDNSDAYPHDGGRWESGDILGVGSAAGSSAVLYGGIGLAIVALLAAILVVLVRRGRAGKGVAAGFCRACGKGLREGDRFCPGCGNQA